MTALNTDAPPVEVKANTSYFRFEPIPASDSYVATLVGFNYLPEASFNRTDAKTKTKTVEVAPGVEFFFGVRVDGKNYFAKSWPKYYSISERAGYYAWYKALTGTAPTIKQRPSDMLGKAALVGIEVAEKVSSKGTKYKAVNIKTVGPVPKILAGTEIPLASFKADFDSALAKSNEKDGKAGGNAGQDENVPF